MFQFKPVDFSMNFPSTRLRRLRLHARLRDLIRETILTANDSILPLFIREGNDIKKPINSMPGHYQLSLDRLLDEIKEVKALGIPGVILFGIPNQKDAEGSASYHHQGIIQQAIRLIKDHCPELIIIADSCFCEYTDHGHCGVMEKYRSEMHLDNDATLELLAQQAVSFAEAGADVIAPSGMVDGMVCAIREGLDDHGFENIPILSYAVKFASGLYGPFREAAEGAPQYGDRKSYQADYANGKAALREAELDVVEGADMLMVKPAGMYLDIIRNVKESYPALPLCAYQVSGEYAMIKSAAANGWIDEKSVALESLTAIKRAGADFIIHYFAKDLARWL